MNAMNELQKAINEIRCEKLRATCSTLDFGSTPASLSYHHAYQGGLWVHTLEVFKYAKIQAFGMRHVDYDVLFTAALWHDAEKVREYMRVDVCPEGTRGLVCPHGFWIKRKSLLGDYAHIIQGAISFTEVANSAGVDEDVIEKIQHCLLAHHGRKEWGSPVEPQTLEALILHQADVLSAKYGETK